MSNSDASPPPKPADPMRLGDIWHVKVDYRGEELVYVEPGRGSAFVRVGWGTIPAVYFSSLTHWDGPGPVSRRLLDEERQAILHRMLQYMRDRGSHFVVQE